MAAFDLLDVERYNLDIESWIARMKAIRERFPDDEVVQVVVSYRLADCFYGGRRYDEALAAYRDALKSWPILEPCDSLYVGKRPQSFQQLREFEQIERRILRRLEPDDKRDVDLRAERNPQTAAEKIATYDEILERFPDGPRTANYLSHLASLLIQEKQFDRAREAFRRCAQHSSDHPRTVLWARLWLLKLDYLHPSRRGDAMSKEDARSRMRQLLAEHERGMRRLIKPDPLALEVLAIYRPRWSWCIAEILASKGHPREPSKWFMLRSATPLYRIVNPCRVELFDGSQRTVHLLPTFNNALCFAGSAIELEGPLGLDHVEESRYVGEVVREVFLVDDQGKLVEFGTPHPYGQITFYDEARTRVRTYEVDPTPIPNDDTDPPYTFLEKRDGQWDPADGEGWFVWR
jgi:hypothetical protein